MTSYAYDAWCDAQGKLYIPYFLIDFSLIQSANMIFPALRRKKKTQRETSPYPIGLRGGFISRLSFLIFITAF